MLYLKGKNFAKNLDYFDDVSSNKCILMALCKPKIKYFCLEQNLISNFEPFIQ